MCLDFKIWQIYAKQAGSPAVKSWKTADRIERERGKEVSYCFSGDFKWKIWKKNNGSLPHKLYNRQHQKHFKETLHPFLHASKTETKNSTRSHWDRTRLSDISPKSWVTANGDEWVEDTGFWTDEWSAQTKDGFHECHQLLTPTSPCWSPRWGQSRSLRTVCQQCSVNILRSSAAKYKIVTPVLPLSVICCTTVHALLSLVFHYSTILSNITFKPSNPDDQNQIGQESNHLMLNHYLLHHQFLLMH